MEFGNWKVLGKPFSLPKAISHRWFVVCQCKCGRISVLATLEIRFSGGCKGCQIARRNHVHGESRTRLYVIFNCMKQRCKNHKHPAWKDYGGRGISVCREWSESYEVFRDWSLANGYSDELEIDRINNDGSYEPENCRWTTRKQQARNMRSTRYLTVNGVTKSVPEWSEQTGLKMSIINSRIRLGWSPEKAVSANAVA